MPCLLAFAWFLVCMCMQQSLSYTFRQHSRSHPGRTPSNATLLSAIYLDLRFSICHCRTWSLLAHCHHAIGWLGVGFTAVDCDISVRYCCLLGQYFLSYSQGFRTGLLFTMHDVAAYLIRHLVTQYSWLIAHSCRGFFHFAARRTGIRIFHVPYSTFPTWVVAILMSN